MRSDVKIVFFLVKPGEEGPRFDLGRLIIDRSRSMYIRFFSVRFEMHALRVRTCFYLGGVD